MRIIAVLLAIVSLAPGSRAAEVVVDAGANQTFSCPSNAGASFSWSLDGIPVGGNSNSYVYSPQAYDVGTHYLLADQTLPGAIHSNTCWAVRVRIPLPVSGTNYYVATNGSDGNPGTLASPFLTLEGARNAIRSRGVPAGGVTIWIRGGTYRRTSTFTLASTDSGRAGSPVVYSAYPGETPVFTTGTLINSNSFSILDSSLWPRVMPGVTASNILQLDLTALGVVNKGPFPTEYGRCPIVNLYSPSSDGGLCELFFNGQRELLSRYPNNNPTNRWLTPYMKMNGVIFKTGTNFMGTNIGGMFYYNPDDAAHIARWQTAAAETNLWIQGFWRVPWESEGERVLLIDTVSNTIATANGATPGVTGFGDKYSGAAGSYNEPYWALNLLEEIDQPGEWSIDFARKKLYFLPPGPVTNGAVVLSDFAAPMFQLNACSNVVISGLSFDISLAQGILITNGVNNLVQDCAFSNLGSFAVDLENGQSNGVVDCDMNRLAAGGVYVRGGSETTPRVSCHDYVVNNDITNFAQVVPVYAAAIDVGFGGMSGGGGGGGHQVCVGVRVAHNHLADTPHGPLIRGSYDKTIEYNRIENYCTISGDFGGIYSYQLTNQGGFDNVRYNYLSCPTNYLYPTYLNPGPPGGIGLQVDNTWIGDQIYGNMANSCRRGGFGAGDAGGSGAAFYNNFTVNIGSGASTAGALNWGGLPDVYATNFAALGSTSIAGDQTGTNLSYSSNPGFLNWTNGDLRLKPDSQVYANLPGFQEIPFELIGLYNDEYRTNAPGYGPYVLTTNATAVTDSNAVFNGTLYFPQFASNTTITVYYGTSDGGSDPGLWQFSTNLGVYAAGGVSPVIGGLAASTSYYYRYYAANPYGSMWSPVSYSLATTAAPVTPGFTNLTGNVTALANTVIVLSGRIVGAGPTYPLAGEPVSVTINGVTQSGVTSDGTGDFSVTFDTTGIPVATTPYVITYGYGGDISLTVATNTATTLSVSPATVTWSGTAGTNFETGGVGGNWSDYAAPINDLTSSTAIFGATPTANQAGLTTNRSVSGLSFTSADGGWTLGGGNNLLSLGTGGVSSAGQGSGTNFISANLAVGANQTWQSGTGGNVLFSGSITNAEASTNYSLTINTSGNTGNIILSPATENSIALVGSNSTASIVQVKSGGTFILGGDGLNAPATTSTNTIINTDPSGTTFGTWGINNGGTVQVNSGTWIAGDLGKNGGDHFNGTISVGGGDLEFMGARYLGGGIINVAGGKFAVTCVGSHKINGGRFSLGTFLGDPHPAAFNVSDGFVDLAQANNGNSIGSAASTLLNQSGGVFQNGVTPGGGVNGGTATSFAIGGTGSGTTNNQSAVTLTGGNFICAGTVLAPANAGPGSVNNFNFMGGTLAVSGLDATYLGSSPGATVTANQTNVSVAIGTLANYGGALAPGNLGVPGLTVITGNYAVSNSAAVLAIDMGGTNPATAFQSGVTNYDVVTVGGNAMLGGSLNVNLIDGFVPAATNRFVILSAGNVSGAFTNVTGGRVSLAGASNTFAVIYTSTNVVLTNFQSAVVVSVAPTNLVAQLVGVGGVPSLVVTGNGGGGSSTYSVLTNGALTTPVTNWPAMLTGLPFGPGGSVNFTSPVSAGANALFHRIRVP